MGDPMRTGEFFFVTAPRIALRLAGNGEWFWVAKGPLKREPVFDVHLHAEILREEWKMKGEQP